ncbi:hypothetical protein [Roseisolibacter agri]|uniref:Uncharacterized protein n=1 Tax=Roseisolibacter agri TaxID=2014610 RepID=A0AA37Q6B3_9BACT|nr:hypothetical protein [Roseisolibacter agri]GLC23791.1 hypothetical protein rosag_03040 [Roseisolibacter agri]
MSRAERAYRLLLRSYPRAFRAAYDSEMLLLFRDQRRDPAARGFRFWRAILWDVARSAPLLRLEALRARWRAWMDGSWDGGGAHFHPQGGSMRARRATAMLAVLGGVFQLVNTGVDGWGGRATGLGGDWVLALGLSAVMGALLLSAGVALLRGGPGATRLVRGAALACLALIAVLQVVFPFMSIFSRLLGVAIPVALLVALHSSGGRRDLSASTPA